jgi:hypothetical protein
LHAICLIFHSVKSQNVPRRTAMKPRGQRTFFANFFSLWITLSLMLSPDVFAKAKVANPTRVQKRVMATPIQRASFVKDGKKFLVTKERSGAGRLIKQSIVGPSSIEVMRDLKNRGVFDYWSVQNQKIKFTASDPLLGVYRRLEIERIYPERGVQKLRYAFRPQSRTYALIEKSFDKVQVLKKESEISAVFVGGALIDDQNKSCGMLNQGYTNDLWDIFSAAAGASTTKRFRDFEKMLLGSNVVDKSCQSPSREVVIEAIADIAITADEDLKISGTPPRFLSCMESLKLSANASNISSILAGATCRRSSLFSCDSSMAERGHYSPVVQPPKPPIAINPGNPEFPESQDEVKKTIFHELVHNSGISDEGMTSDVEKCCSQRPGDFTFENAACVRVQAKVQAVSESHQTQKILTGSSNVESYVEFVEQVRSAISPAGDSQNTISDAFNKRAEVIFQEEYSNFKSEIAPQGGCSHLPNSSKCFADAKNNFVTSFSNRISETCKEGTYQASMRVPTGTEVEAACKQIEKAATKLANSASGVMTFKEFKEKCGVAEGSVNSSYGKGWSSKSVVFIELLQKIMTEAHAQIDLLGKPAAPQMSMAPTVPQLEIFKSPAAEDLVGRCQVASDCYDIPSSLVGAAEVSAGNSRNQDDTQVNSKWLDGGQSPAVLAEVRNGGPVASTAFVTSPAVTTLAGKAGASAPSSKDTSNNDSKWLSKSPEEINLGGDSSVSASGELFRKLDPAQVSRVPDPEKRTSRILLPLMSAFENIIPAAQAAPSRSTSASMQKFRDLTQDLTQDDPPQAQMRKEAVGRPTSSAAIATRPSVRAPSNISSASAVATPQRKISANSSSRSGAARNKEANSNLSITELQKQLKSLSSASFEEKISEIEFRQKLIELEVQVIRRDGMRVGSQHPTKIIRFHPQLKKYFLTNLEAKAQPQ